MKELKFLDMKNYCLKKSSKGQLLIIEKRSGKCLSINEGLLNFVMANNKNKKKKKGWLWKSFILSTSSKRLMIIKGLDWVSGPLRWKLEIV